MASLTRSLKTALNTGMTTMASRALATQAGADLAFNTLKVTHVNDSNGVFHVELNRPEKRNAMSPTWFSELKQCFDTLKYHPDCRSVVLSGAGKCFTSGLDLSELTQVLSTDIEDPGRRSFLIRKIVGEYQASISSVEKELFDFKCHKPVIACIHGFCIGGGVDLIAACDMRYCTQDAWFSIKEVDVGLAADIGTLQRLPKIVGNDSLVRELVYTSRKFTADEAKEMGLVSRVLPDHESLLKTGLEIAKLIASKSPIAVQGSKINLNYSRDHSVDEGLEFMTTWSASMLQSEDLVKSAMGAMAKETPVFAKL